MPVAKKLGRCVVSVTHSVRCSADSKLSRPASGGSWLAWADYGYRNWGIGRLFQREVTPEILILPRPRVIQITIASDLPHKLMHPADGILPERKRRGVDFYDFFMDLVIARFCVGAFLLGRMFGAVV